MAVDNFDHKYDNLSAACDASKATKADQINTDTTFISEADDFLSLLENRIMDFLDIENVHPESVND
jgi:hypothetical protein